MTDFSNSARLHPTVLRIPSASELQLFEPDPDMLLEHHIVGFDSQNIQSRPFNLLRSQIVKRLESNDWNVIGITSATPAVGKSFLSLNLAAALSGLSDQMVYLFDFDLRRASLAQALGLNRSVGLMEFLEGKTDDLKSIGRRVIRDNLVLFPCYTSSSDSAGLLVGERFDQLFEAIRALPKKAIVICDLPPAFANDDAILITQQLDAYLLVVEQGITTKKQVTSTINLLAPTVCLGVALNRYSGGLGDPYGYNNAGYYKYYSARTE